MLRAIRRVPETQQVFEPRGYRHDRAIVRESVEAVFTVVGAGSGMAYAAEGGVWDAGVQHDVVDCYAA